MYKINKKMIYIYFQLSLVNKLKNYYHLCFVGCLNQQKKFVNKKIMKIYQENAEKSVMKDLEDIYLAVENIARKEKVIMENVKKPYSQVTQEK